MKTGNLIITDHAIVQLLRRTSGLTTVENRIRKLAKHALEIKPKDKLSKLLTNGCKNSGYYLRDGMVLVVLGNKIITIYEFDHENFHMPE